MKESMSKKLSKASDAIRRISTPLYFDPLNWRFWRNLVTCFAICCIIGHWFEIPYCLLMDNFFGIVEDDYAVFHDPWYFPYWVYGFGAIIMTLFIEPFKEHFLKVRKTKFGAVLETFVFAVILAAAMELLFGLIVNQPDEFGVYPYWDNSQLPLNIFGQAWLVNDLAIGLVAVLYLWVIYPLVCNGYEKLSTKAGLIVFGFVVAAFAVACIVSYIPIWIGLLTGNPV